MSPDVNRMSRVIEALKQLESRQPEPSAVAAVLPLPRGEGRGEGSAISDFSHQSLRTPLSDLDAIQELVAETVETELLPAEKPVVRHDFRTAAPLEATADPAKARQAASTE